LACAGTEAPRLTVPFAHVAHVRRGESTVANAAFIDAWVDRTTASS
jgi:hypothetical protein